MSKQKSSKKGCLIFIGVILGAIIIFFALNWDAIQEDTNNAHDYSLANIDTINQSLAQVANTLNDFKQEDSLLIIAEDIVLDNTTMLYCTWEDILSIGGKEMDNHFVYTDIQSYKELLTSPQEQWNVFEAEDITENLLTMTHAFVVKIDTFLLPKEIGEESFEPGIAQGTCFVIDLSNYVVIGHVNFEATNSSDIEYGGGVDISIGKIIPVGNIGGTEFEEALTADFYKNCNTAINGAWDYFYY